MIAHALALALAAAAPAPAPAPAAADLQTGDLVFQASGSSQSAAIRAATHSPWSHVGVIVVEGERAFVIEAAAHVQKTPLASFLARGVGGAYTVLRMPGLDDNKRARIAAYTKAEIGKRYDALFMPGDAALYCSELARRAFDHAGVEVGAWQRAGDLDFASPVVRALLEQRWRKHPACRGSATLDACIPKLAAIPVITPASMAADPRLIEVTRR